MLNGSREWKIIQSPHGYYTPFSLKKSNIKENENMNIHDYLIESGIYPNLKGFRYIIKAVEIVKKNPAISFTRELYPEIAKTFNATTSSVERGIRHIVSDKISTQDYKRIGLKVRPTNAEFIHYFAMKGGKR